MKKIIKKITLSTASLALITTGIGTTLHTVVASSKNNASKNLTISKNVKNAKNAKVVNDSYTSIWPYTATWEQRFTFSNETTQKLWAIISPSFDNQKDGGWNFMHYIADKNSGQGFKYGYNFWYSLYIIETDLSQYNTVCNFLQGLLPVNQIYKSGFNWAKFVKDLKQSSSDNAGLYFNIVNKYTDDYDAWYVDEYEIK